MKIDWDDALVKFLAIVMLLMIAITSMSIGFSFGKDKANKDLLKEREYCNAWMELAHHYLFDNNPAHPGDSIEKNNYWYDVVMESDYYQKIDSLNGGYWEDWYCNWE